MALVASCVQSRRSERERLTRSEQEQELTNLAIRQRRPDKRMGMMSIVVVLTSWLAFAFGWPLHLIEGGHSAPGCDGRQRHRKPSSSSSPSSSSVSIHLCDSLDLKGTNHRSCVPRLTAHSPSPPTNDRPHHTSMWSPPPMVAAAVRCRISRCGVRPPIEWIRDGAAASVHLKCMRASLSNFIVASNSICSLADALSTDTSIVDSQNHSGAGFHLASYPL